MANREHRYRAWHKKEKIYLSLDRLSDAYHVPVIPGDKLAGWFALDGKRVVFEQWTGLIDRNYDPIFEGDIVRGSWSKELQPMVVIYQAPSFVMKTQIRHKMWSTFMLHHDSPQSYTIIGNIRQNPELLK